MKVLSLFNGVGFGAMALSELGIAVEEYYSSEIDAYANKAAQLLYPDTIQVGDVTGWRDWDIEWAGIDLLLAGFPCQAWSPSGGERGDNDPRGALVHDLIDIWDHIKSLNPGVKFMFENVKMKKSFSDYIDNLFGVKHVCINADLVSAQSRPRYYWTNIGGIKQPEQCGITLLDVIERGDVGSKYIASEKCLARMSRRNYSAPKIMPEKTGTINTANNSGRWCLDAGTTLVTCAETGRYEPSGEYLRRLTPVEVMRLQGVPSTHIHALTGSGISQTQLYKMIGNGWALGVIIHIFKGLKNG